MSVEELLLRLLETQLLESHEERDRQLEERRQVPEARIRRAVEALDIGVKKSR